MAHYFCQDKKNIHIAASLCTMALQFSQYIFQRSFIIVFGKRSKKSKKGSQIQMDKIENEHIVVRGKQWLKMHASGRHNEAITALQTLDISSDEYMYYRSIL
jgi:hypothetical protein